MSQRREAANERRAMKLEKSKMDTASTPCASYTYYPRKTLVCSPQGSACWSEAASCSMVRHPSRRLRRGTECIYNWKKLINTDCSYKIASLSAHRVHSMTIDGYELIACWTLAKPPPKLYVICNILHVVLGKGCVRKSNHVIRNWQNASGEFGKDEGE